MLQISTGKFFKYEAHETLRRAIYYTNYRIFRKDEVIETTVGSLQLVVGGHGLGALTCDIIERIEKLPGGPYSGEMTATDGESLINDFAAIISFALNVTCTTDLELARRLVASERPTLGTDVVPQKYVPRMFDRAVNYQPSDVRDLQHFVSDLMALERKSYEAVMRAIRRYVSGAHRISDDVNLAYALFVMSMESLVQKFDGFEPAWDNYPLEKRQRIDKALEEAPEPIAKKVRDAILANEHLAMSRRFCEFVLAHVDSTFYRDETRTVVNPVSQYDLTIALKQAYKIRSSYVHELKDIPSLLVGLDGFHETTMVEGQPNLTFAGLTRVARNVIKTCIARAPKTSKEEFEWRRNLPGTLRMQLAPELWIHNSEAFNQKTASQYLGAFIDQIVAHLLQPSAKVTDISLVLKKIEELVPTLQKSDQRLPMLALHFLFNYFASSECRSAQYDIFCDKYRSDFEKPSIISMVVHLLTDNRPDWPLAEMEVLHADYFGHRHLSKSFKLGRILEAAFTLMLAEQKREMGDATRARELIAMAVNTCPGHENLRNFEASSQTDELPKIDWRAILLPMDTSHR